jgi:hypothetical protein
VTGPFGGDTKNPILFVSNTFDPATPLINSQTWSPLYKGSQVLVIDGIGVSYLFCPTAENVANFRIAHVSWRIQLLRER